MTVQEYTTIKTIIYACSTAVYENGQRVPYADTDRVIASLDKIFADELGVEHELMLRRLWQDQDDAKRELEKQNKAEEAPEEKSSAANFLMKIIRRSK